MLRRRSTCLFQNHRSGRRRENGSSREFEVNVTTCRGLELGHFIYDQIIGGGVKEEEITRDKLKVGAIKICKILTTRVFAMRVPTWNVEIGHGHFFFSCLFSTYAINVGAGMGRKYYKRRNTPI